LTYTHQHTHTHTHTQTIDIDKLESFQYKVNPFFRV